MSSCRPSVSRTATVALGILLTLAGCTRESDAPQTNGFPRDGSTPTVYTTFYPTTYFTERIGGDAVRVVCPVPRDADPIFWVPDATTLQAYQNADLIVVNGAELEKWVGKVSLPGSRVVDTAAGFADRFLRYEEAFTHSHGPAGEHSHEGIDGHTWLDPLLSIEQARAIEAALSRRSPGDSETFRANLQSLEGDLRSLHDRLVALQPRMKDTPILCSHPAYNYIARRYEWDIHNLDLDPEAALRQDVIDSIRETQGEHAARILLWESEPREDTRDRLLRELEIRSVVFSPCEQPAAVSADSGGDYLARMQSNIDRLEAALP